MPLLFGVCFDGMSLLEHYERELANLDREIRHYAAICGVDLANRYELDACLKHHRDNWPDDKARESLAGLLVLRIKLEEEMIRDGCRPEPLLPPAAG